jgi:hypothetical protein
LLSLAGLTAGKLYGNSAANNAIPPQLSQLLDMSVNRAQTQQPLFNAATSGMYQMLPDFAKNGAGLGTPSGGVSQATSGTASMPTMPATSAGVGPRTVGSALGGYDPNMNGSFSQAVDAIRNIFPDNTRSQ